MLVRLSVTQYFAIIPVKNTWLKIKWGGDLLLSLFCFLKEVPHSNGLRSMFVCFVHSAENICN